MALLNSLFEKVPKKDGTDPESASFLPSKDNSDHEQEEEATVPGSCVTPAAEMERDPLGHVVSAHTIADIILDKTTEMPLTVGVFGGFGSGKSSFHAAIKKEVLKRTSVVQHYKKKIDERGVIKKGNKKEEPKNLLDRIDFYLILFCYTAMVCLFVCLFTWSIITATIMSGLMFPLAFYYLLAGTLTAVFPIGVYYREYVGQLARLVAARLPALFARSSPMYHILRTYLDIQVNQLDKKLLQEPPETRTDVIWVDFNAWVFSGCNVLWAGIVTRLCDEVEAHIGANNVRLFRSIQAKAEASAAQPNQRILFPQWFRLLATLVVGVGLATLAAVGINLQAVAQGQFPPGVVALVPLLVGLLAKGKSAVSFGRSMVKSQSDNITSLMAQQGFAEQLGFMSEVKKEIQTVKSLLAYLERTTNIRYRIVVVVDDLSDCQEDRVVGVLQALKVLLSDEDANIISILCVNSAQVVKCVEGSLKQLEDSDTSGYKYLNEIVNFAVCLPEPGVVAMKEVLAKATPGEVGQQLATQMAAEKAAAAPAEEAAGPDNVSVAAAPAAEGEAANVLPLLLDALKNGDVMPYIKGNPRYIRDLYFVLRMTAGVVEYQMKLGEFDTEDWDKLVAWVVLVQQWPYQVRWPYRSSWIVLHAEDLELKAVMKKREKLSGCVEQGPDDYMDKKLLAIFKSAQEKQKELEKKGEALKRLNSLDGDTELLELFLQEFDFSVQDMFDLLPVTTNLDSSIKMAINSAIGQA
ncbi:PREDICTED: NTPase KAP family P-loop domain-containing protein 1-like [Branchiostoma belcheri]|uniref:NTPase KAP family P-loop domain-containing protein 1-like n=1 Tax=Branchiostoma belcheri TaxID=7741 RepID=A0A6P4YP16_BRABE|nr:PREDICTED: NTPase KAP family P-loop domain-containing protein 1-like [Branchiostoma belcheri]